MAGPSDWLGFLREFHPDEVCGDADESITRLSPKYSRSLTIWSALQRLGLLERVGDSPLTLHIVGADMQEGGTVDATFAVFEPLCQLLGRAGCRQATLVLCGPNLAPRLLGSEHTRDVGEVRLAIAYRGGLYHDMWVDGGAPGVLRPDAAFCFNAGVWGYPQWVPTLELLVSELRVPVVVTAYNSTEAEDDADVFAELSKPCAVAWGPQANPFGSHHVCESKAVPGLLKAENSFWQCNTATNDAGSGSPRDST